MRITNQMQNNNLIHTLSRQQNKLQQIEKNLATGKSIHLPSDDPIGAAHQMMYRTRLNELEQYERNLNESYQRLNSIDGKLNSVTEIFQRVRYLTVQGANGTNTNFELKEAIAKEIDEHLKALVDIGNAKDSTGRALFGGSIIERDPFLSINTDLGLDGQSFGEAITSVQYQGDFFTHTREIEKNEHIEVSIPGNKVFWGTNMQISSNKDSSQYQALSDQSFIIDNTEIFVSAGDTINDIITKINKAPIEIKAIKGNQDDIILTSTSPRQIWLEDKKDGTTLQDIGLLDPQKSEPPNNYQATATVSGMSIFDVLITLRDDLIRGDQELIGGRDLEAIDIALENVLRYRGEVGSKVNRVEQHQKRLSWDNSYITELLSKNEGVDITEKIIDFKWLENVHNYALKVGAGIIKPTLLDFLR